MSNPEQPAFRPIGRRIVSLSIVFATVDLLAVPLIVGTDSPFVTGIFFGAAGGQVALASIWGVLGPRPLYCRWPLVLVFLMLGYWLFALGLAASGAAALFSGYFFCGSLLLPILLLVTQFPIWLLRLATGCRIVRVSGGPLPARSRQFRLQDLFCVVTIVAVALGLARLWSLEFGPGDLTEIAPALGIASLWTAFVTLPCIYAGLAARNVPSAVWLMTGYALAMTVLVMVLIAVLAGAGPSQAMGMVFAFLLFFNGAAIATVFGTLALARREGYVLLWPRRKEPEPQAADAACGQEQNGVLNSIPAARGPSPSGWR